MGYSLHFDGRFDVPEAVLKIMCTDPMLAKYRVDLYQEVIPAKKRFLLIEGRLF